MSEVAEHMTISLKAAETSIPTVMYEITRLKRSRLESSAPGARLPASCRSCSLRSDTSLFLDRRDRDYPEVGLGFGEVPPFRGRRERDRDREREDLPGRLRRRGGLLRRSGGRSHERILKGGRPKTRLRPGFRSKEEEDDSLLPPLTGGNREDRRGICYRCKRGQPMFSLQKKLLDWWLGRAVEPMCGCNFYAGGHRRVEENGWSLDYAR